MLSLKGVNLVAVLVAWVFAMVLGSIWYGPIFGKAWQSAVGLGVNLGNPGLAMAVMAITYFVIAYTLGILVKATDSRTWHKGLHLGVLIGVGFLAATALTNVLFENRSMNLFWINGTYAALKMAGMGAILGGWKKKK